MDDKDETVVKTALQALTYLAEEPLNCPVMREEIGLVPSLKNLVINEKRSKEIKDSATDLLHQIISSQSPSRRPVSVSRKPSMSRGSMFLGASNKKARNIVLQIQGLEDHTHRQLAEQHLLEVKGVISFTFDMSQKRCTVRARSTLKPETLCHAVGASQLLTADQVVKNEFGEEVLLSFGKEPQARKNVENTTDTTVKLPDYLPEDHDTPELLNDKALVRTEDANSSGTGGWFSSVGSFLAKSFYW